jgi:hypothetical protein
VAVAIEAISADSLRKTGISADRAGDFRRSAPQDPVTVNPETKSITRNAGISGPFSRLLGTLAGRMNAWLGCEDSNRTLSLVRQKRQNLFPLKLISNSKCSDFENRTEWMESRGSEKNGPFGE